MAEQLIEWVATLPGHWAVAFVLFLLLLCGFGLPLPEEIPIVAATYLAYEGDVSLPLVVVLLILAILVGDSCLFLLGRKFGNKIFEIHPFKNLMTQGRMKKTNDYFHRWGSRVVFVARFIAGVRGTIFLTAGILKMPFRRFLLLDGLAASISIPINVLVVHWLFEKFGDELGDALRAAKKVGRTSFLVVLLVVGFFSLIAFLRKRKRTNGT